MPNILLLEPIFLDIMSDGMVHNHIYASFVIFLIIRSHLCEEYRSAESNVKGVISWRFKHFSKLINIL
jgi:hypothetical protein